MGYQFVHLESFSRKGDDKGRSTAFVLAEARRDPAASVHVAARLPPVVVYGRSGRGGPPSSDMWTACDSDVI